MMGKRVLVLLISLMGTSFILCNTDLPLIAILSYPKGEDILNMNKAFVDARYVRWLEASGADSIVINPWQCEEEVKEILSKVNGVAIQGGVYASTNMNCYVKQVETILTQIIKLQDDKNIRLPLIAISEGFHILCNLISGHDYSTNLTTKNKSIPIKLYPESNISNSRLFSLFSKEYLYNFTNLPLSYSNHVVGLAPSIVEKDKTLNDFLKITAIGLDDHNKEFIAAAESINYPIYGMQFHPEVNCFTKNAAQEVNNSIEAIKLSRAVGNFFVQEAKAGNSNKMAKEEYATYNYIEPYSNFPTKINEDYYYVFTQRPI